MKILDLQAQAEALIDRYLNEYEARLVQREEQLRRLRLAWAPRDFFPREASEFLTAFVGRETGAQLSLLAADFLRFWDKALGADERPVDTSPESIPSYAVLLCADRNLTMALAIGSVSDGRRRRRLLSPQPELRRFAFNRQVEAARLANALLQRARPCTDEELAHILDAAMTDQITWWIHHSGGIVQTTLRDAADYVRTHGPSLALNSQFHRILTLPPGWDKLTRAQRLLIEDLFVGGKSERHPVCTHDTWGQAVRSEIATFAQPLAVTWTATLRHAAALRTPAPKPSWLTQAHSLIDKLGVDRFRTQVVAWLNLRCAQPPAPSFQGHVDPGYQVICEENRLLLRGLAWLCSEFGDAEVARTLAATAEYGFGLEYSQPRSPMVGAACIAALGQMPGPHGIPWLVRLSQRLKSKPAQKAVTQALNSAAAARNLTVHDVEELTVPTFDLVDGRFTTTIAGFTAELSVSPTRQVDLRWTGPDGNPRKTVPAAAKREQGGAAWKQLKQRADDLRVTLATQRDRLERTYLHDRSWSLADWRERYLEHPLLSLLTRTLIWTFETDAGRLTAIPHDGTLVSATGQPIPPLAGTTRVRLWHPALSDPEQVMAWRTWLEQQGIVQPFKQAHREVYLLTEAERRTETYSNRFAAHILRQHQFHKLCLQRGWEATLQLAYEGGPSASHLRLPQHGLAVEFWWEGIGRTEADWSPAGVYLHVATDQVRFLSTTDYQPLPLDHIPPLVLSEVLRDVDLFVGVTSVGADPTWRDTGPDAHRTYWERYAFGDLSTSAENRRDILASLVPRLAIAPRCALTDRFLVIRGDLRTYRIHLGSGNILMEPGSQYLCIVPDRRTDATPTPMLPFEGDATLALILSKAFLLASDTTITDPTITRQIRR